MADKPWEFSIDVGGTFTDVLARGPDGRSRRLKLLSSGVTKGQIGAGSTVDAIVDPARENDPPEFWNGFQLAIIGDNGAQLDAGEVVALDRAAGRLRLRGLNNVPPPGAIYELRSSFDAPVLAIRYVLALPSTAPVPPIILRLGTTRGTNALITRRGARTALVTTRGFGDVLEIGYQVRPRLFDLTVRKSPPLSSVTLEVDERVTHAGEVLIPLDEATVREQFASLRRSGIESLAICLLHADRHPAHEQAVARLARSLGFAEISTSHEAAPLPKMVARADTTVVDAYLNPVLREYVARLAASLPGSQIRLLTSAGGLVSANEFRGKDSILSGPAGGVVGFSRAAEAAGFDAAIGFDMGGTSTDVARYDQRLGGQFELEYETQKAGVRIVAPTMAIETVAAGGGSICRFDGVKLVVGPESAGADPGPACYGRGGPLTVTDCNLLLGRIAAERFPFPLDREAAQVRLGQLAAEAASPYSLEELAAGLLRIANANMAAAIRLVTVAKGANPADHLLVAFGSAAPQHACAVARELGIRQVLVHPDAGILSAVGISLADVTRHRSLGVERPMNSDSLTHIRRELDALEQAAIADVELEGVPSDRIIANRSLELRYQGVDSALAIAWPADNDFETVFTAAHRQRYGYIHAGRQLDIAAARVEVVGHVADRLSPSERAPAKPAKASRHVTGYFDGQSQDVPYFERGELLPGNIVIGPALIVEPMSASVVELGWQAELLTRGELLLTDIGAQSSQIIDQRSSISVSPDPVFLEIFNNLLSNIAAQMGVTLRNTACSVNVKERLDFSCAIFTADGRLVANAPHVPVHLGAMGETVRHVIAANPDLAPGDVFATNDPYTGGSHLPDITVVTPVHNAADELLFFTANRAHHAEIGGVAPGSMPPLSTNLAEEGVLICNLRIVERGNSQFDELKQLLNGGRYPSRNVAANLADMEAQVAANRRGAIDLIALVERYSQPVVAAYMEHVQDAAEQKVRQSLARLPAGAHAFTDYLETADGQSVPIAVRFTIRPPESKTAAIIDFTGTGPVVAGNLNANRAIVTAAVIYVLRLLVDDDIPLNHGVIRAVDIMLPECLLNPNPGGMPSLAPACSCEPIDAHRKGGHVGASREHATQLDPGSLPAVAGGNVETSQRVVDVLLGALGLAGASQGTMNNLLFGDTTFGYYETICGGSGATADGDGASAVQVHMTNTRLTDPEILERRFPVRVRKFAIRRGSGGTGRHRGGDGTIRELEFLRPLTVSLITQRRGPHPPYGAQGGEPGALGRNRLVRRGGTTIDLPGIIQLSVEAGEVLIVETPGGGGFGEANTKEIK